MSAKRIVITGATSGIGKALCLQLLMRGEDVIAIGRSAEKLSALNESSKGFPGRLHVYKADFKSLKSVVKMVESLKSDYQSGIDVLINNAAIVPKKRTLSDDGIEMQFQVNHLIPFYMSMALKDLLQKRKGIIITTSSNAHKKARFVGTDIEVKNNYHALRGYARTKLYNVMFTKSLNEHLDNTSIKAYAVHPGVVSTEIGTKNTSKLYAAMWKLYTKRGMKPEEATQTYLDLMYGTIETNKHFYFYKSQPHLPNENHFTTQDRKLLWNYSLKLLKEKSAS